MCMRDEVVWGFGVEAKLGGNERQWQASPAPDSPTAPAPPRHTPVVVGRPEGVLRHRPARRKDHKVCHSRACRVGGWTVVVAGGCGWWPRMCALSGRCGIHSRRQRACRGGQAGGHPQRSPGTAEGAVSTVKMDGSGWSKLTALTAGGR